MSICPIRGRWAFVLILLVASSISCRRVSDTARASKTRRTVESHGLLELTTQTRDDGLRDELSRLVGEKATPVQLTATRAHAKEGLPGVRRARHFVADRDNVAPAMLAAIPEQVRISLRKELDDSYPRSAHAIDSGPKLARLWQILATHSAEAEAYRQALARPECDFAVQYTHGLLADMSYVDVALIGNRLLGLTALKAITTNDSAGAVGALAPMFRAANLVGEAGHVTARVASARMRSEAFQIVELLARDPSTRPEDLQAIYGLLAQQWAAWPDEATTWIGERAIGLHAYEMVRDGQILSLFTFEELSEIGKLGLDTYCAKVYQGIDADESFYLATMRSLIHVGSLPYYQRKEVVDEIRHEFERRSTADERCRVAELLLKDLEWSQRLMARDRGLFEGWSIAFSLATGHAVPEDARHPLTGKPYVIVQSENSIEVSGVDFPSDSMDSNGATMDDWLNVHEPLVVPRIARQSPDPQPPDAQAPTGSAP